jgi:hypothetical protein
MARTRQRELAHMAARPFASFTVLPSGTKEVKQLKHSLLLIKAL